MINALINATVLLLISGIHVYWAIGGTWAMNVAVPQLPQKTDAKAFSPGPLLTLLVAAGLAAMAGLHLHHVGWLNVPLPNWLTTYGLWVIGGIFLLRVIGDFKYVGIFKQVTDTPFARMDTAYYIPLCLVLSINAFWVAVLP